MSQSTPVTHEDGIGLSLDGLATKSRKTREPGRNVHSTFGTVTLGVSICEGLWEQR